MPQPRSIAAQIHHARTTQHARTALRNLQAWHSEFCALALRPRPTS